jgi:uncharacterized protein YcbK (DUF882 family)
MDNQLTKDFHLSEFACKDGTPVPEQYYENVKKVAENLQVLRDAIGEPVFISGSGYRTPEHNKKVGGAPKSQHLTASAADISVKSLTPKQLAAKIERLIKDRKMKQGGIGIYPGFVHYDIRGRAARW